MSGTIFRLVCKNYIKGFLEREPYERHWIFGGRKADLPLGEALHEFYKSTWEHMNDEERKILAACWVYWILHDVWNIPERELDQVDISNYIDLNLTLDENLSRLAELLPTLRTKMREYEERKITPEEERIAAEMEMRRGPLEPKEALKILDEIIDELLAIEDPKDRVSAFMTEFNLPKNPPEIDGYRDALDAFSYALQLLRAQKVQKDKLKKQLERLTRELQITTTELERIKHRLREYRAKLERLPAWVSVPAETLPQPTDRPAELKSEKDVLEVIRILERDTGLPFAMEYDFTDKVYRIRALRGAAWKTGLRIYIGEILTEKKLYELSKNAWRKYLELKGKLRKPPEKEVYRRFREKWKDVLELYPTVDKQLETLSESELETLEKIFTNALDLLDRVERGEITLKEAIREYREKMREIEEFIRKYNPPEDIVRVLRDPTFPLMLKQNVMREYLEMRGVIPPKAVRKEKIIKVTREIKPTTEYVRTLSQKEIERLIQLIEKEFGFRPTKISMVIKLTDNLYEILGFTEIGAPFDVFIKFKEKSPR